MRRAVSMLTVLVVLGVFAFACAPAPQPAAPTAAKPAAAQPAAAPTVAQPPAGQPTVAAKESSQSASKPIVWRFSNYTAATAPATEIARWAFSEIEKRTNGRFSVQYFWNGTLVPRDDEPDAMKNDMIDAATFMPNQYPAKMPIAGIGGWPFMSPLSRADQARVQMEWGKNPAVVAEFAKWGAMMVSPNSYGRWNYVGNRRIASVADLKGVRLNTPTPATWQAIHEKYGAVLTIIPLPDSYDAMSKGVFDVLLTSNGAMQAYRLQEVSKYYTDLEAPSEITFFVVRKKAYDALPADIKTVFDDVMKDAPMHSANYFDSVDQAVVDTMKKANVEIVKMPAQDIATYEQLAKELVWQPMIDKYTKEQNVPMQQLVDAYLALKKK